MTRVIIYPRDYVLLIALMMMCGLIFMNWSDYKSCRDPLNVWLVVDFMSFIFFRLLQFAVQYFGSLGGSINRKIAAVLAVANLYVVYPFIWVWVIVGTAWYSRSKSCLPESTSSWWFVAWLIYSYLYLLAFGALIISFYRMRRREGQVSFGNLQALLDEYLRAEAYGLQARRGMPEQDILALETRCIDDCEIDTGASCAICMNDFKPKEMVRDIPCKHFFHSACLDQWLRLNATCPCCRENIAGVDEETALLGNRTNIGGGRGAEGKDNGNGMQSATGPSTLQGRASLLVAASVAAGSEV